MKAGDNYLGFLDLIRERISLTCQKGTEVFTKLEFDPKYIEGYQFAIFDIVNEICDIQKFIEKYETIRGE